MEYDLKTLIRNTNFSLFLRKFAKLIIIEYFNNKWN